MAPVQTETSIGGGDEPAQCHQQRAQPDPAHERLDVHAHGPGIAAQRFADGDVQIAGRTTANHDAITATTAAAAASALSSVPAGTVGGWISVARPLAGA